MSWLTVQGVAFRSGVAAVLVVAMSQAASAGSPAARSGTLVELFTSQGCSSCPPADKLLGSLRTEPGVIALSFNVDYWDYLGWKDTLGSPANTERQRRYASVRGDGEVYTPQVVVNGRTHAVGSQSRAVTAAIAEAAALPHPSLNAGVSAGVITVEAGAAARAGDKATVWLAEYRSEAPVDVQRGENAGSTVIYHNVVRRLVKLGSWDGTARSWQAPIAAEAKGDGFVVFLQQGQGGPVLAAIELPGALADTSN